VDTTSGDVTTDLQYTEETNDQMSIDYAMEPFSDLSHISANDLWPFTADFWDFPLESFHLDHEMSFLDLHNIQLLWNDSENHGGDENTAVTSMGISNYDTRSEVMNVQEISSPAADEQSNNVFTFFTHPRFTVGSPEMIAMAFHHQTCRILSIHEPDVNPWRTLIWPMAKDCVAVYHALAAMACFHMSKAQPELHVQGITHTKLSMERLSATSGEMDMDIETTLAATLALSFAEAFDHKRSSTGSQHIKTARYHLEQTRARSYPIPSDSLRFLAKTLMYLDAIARLTSNDDHTRSATTRPPELGFRDMEDDQIDSLMGYASSLFPTLSCVADMTCRIRKRTGVRNSPAIISQAIELRMLLQEWVPPVELSKRDNVTWLMRDAVQVAEAYRWATLLLISQAVPELPLLTPMWNLAEKVMVFLATIPISSNTTIVQIFPLLVAGCEAVEEEDRDWVRDRWKEMAKRMITGIVDRCLEVTLEVWKRRDEHGLQHGLCRVTGVKQPPLSSPPLNQDQTITPGDLLAFTVSTAFGSNVDHFTRSGNSDYTVRGRLHWMGVMKDWNWEGT
jgi:hypothetical protein